MGRYLADALRRRLARQQADGNEDGAAATEARLKALEADSADVDLTELLKADLIKRADAAGIDPTGMTKAEIIAELEKAGGEGET